MPHVGDVMLTSSFHGISHMFVVVISQQLVYIPWGLGRVQTRLLAFLCESEGLLYKLALI